MPRTIGAARFKEQCLAILDELDAEGVVITKHGRPISKLVPIEVESSVLIGALRDQLKIRFGGLPSVVRGW